MNIALLDPNARKPFPELLENYVYEPGPEAEQRERGGFGG
jgi:hypothetical protein